MSVQTRHPSSPSEPSDASGPGVPPVLPTPGWYPDPCARARLRYWTGNAWSSWVSDGSTVRSDPQGLRRRLGAADLAHLDFIEHVFLPEAEAAGCVTPAEAPLLEGLARRMEAEARGAGVVPVVGTRPTAAAGAHPTGASTPAQVVSTPAGTAPAPTRNVPEPLRPSPTPAPALPPSPVQPSALARWWARTREAVGSDLAVHGLAYVGVLLFFVGAFGLVVFAFGDVSPGLRPVAELVIALAPFAAAALLLRRGATIVGRALEVTGGLLIPVMVITSFLDDNPVPPDVYGVQLAGALTALTSLVAVAYAAWSRWHTTSALRYLVAPVAWLAVAMATLGLGREIPDGKAVATPGAAQMAAVMAALVVSVALARFRPDHRLAAPTRVAALPGLVVIAALGLLSGFAESWPVGPALVSGALALIALELLSDRVPAVVVGVVEPMWWAYTSIVLAAGADGQSIAVASVAAVAAAGFLAILEAAALARRSGLALLLPSIGLVAALAATWSDPWWAVGCFGAATIWAVARRMAPFPVGGAPLALDTAAAALPAGAVLALGQATDLPVTALTGGALVLLATVPARLPYLRRGPDDRYWTSWWLIAGVATLLLTLTSWQAMPWVGLEPWLFVATLAVLTVSSSVGPIAARWRPPVVTGLAGLTWVAAADALDVSTLAVVTPLALLGLALVVVAHRLPSGRPRVDAVSLGLTGHALGLVTIVMAIQGSWAPVVAVALATGGWSVTGWLDANGRSPVGSGLGRASSLLAWLPLALTALGLPVTASLALDRAGLVPFENPWSVAVPVLTAVAYAGVSRLALPDRVIAVATWGGFLSALAAALGAGSRVELVAGLAAIPVVVSLLRPQRRSRVMTWTAWAVLAPLAGLLAAELSTWFDALPTETAVATSLVTVGSFLLVGGAASDLRGRSWTPHVLPEHAWVLPPVVIGALEVLLGIVVAAALPSDEAAGWMFAAASAALLATAVLSRVGARAGVSVLLAWVAVLLLAHTTVSAQPWIAVVTSLAILVAAQTFSMVDDESRLWARWDLPLLVSAVPVAGTALVVATGQPTVALTFTAVGAECLAVAARLRRSTVTALLVGATGALLVLVGAGTAGTGWLALALLGLSAALTALAVATDGPARAAFQVAGAVAALAAWRLAVDAWALPDQRAAEIAALWAAGAAVAWTGAAFLTRIARSWVLVWGGLAVAVEAVCAWDALAPVGILQVGVDPSWPVTAGVAVTAAALAGAAATLRIPWLRDLAAGFAFGSLFIGLLAADAPIATQVIILSVLCAVGAVAVLALSRTPVAQRWRRPLMGLGTVSALWAFAVVVSTDSDPVLLVPVLAAAAGLAAAIGVVLRQTLLQTASPILACAAWLLFSAEALDGNPQWVTVPIGLAILAVVALWRRDRKERGGRLASAEIVALELVGIAFLVGAAFVQAVTVTVAYALLSAAVGLSVSAWGVVSRVRRRLAAGVGIVLVSVVLLVVVPLVAVLPSLDAAAFWIIILAAGLVALAVASLLDWGKATARRELTRFAEATSGWE